MGHDLNMTRTPNMCTTLLSPAFFHPVEPGLQPCLPRSGPVTPFPPYRDPPSQVRTYLLEPAPTAVQSHWFGRTVIVKT